MTPEQQIKATAEETARQKSLEMLFDYTKFHIGLYLTITASYIAAAAAEIDNKPLFHLNKYFVIAAIVLFMIAGLAGGTIASSITQTEKRSSREFLDDKDGIGPWHWKQIYFKARNWTYIEHTAFWVGLIAAALSFLL